MNKTAQALQEAAKEMQKDIENSPFPNLEKLADEFYEKNEFPTNINLLRRKKLISKIKTNEGLILHFGGDDLVLLSVSNPNIMREHVLHPYLGENGSHMHSTEEQIYHLSGRLYEQQISLETNIISTQDYNIEKRGGLCNCCAPVAVANGEPKITFRRQDDFPYWFITEPKKTSKKEITLGFPYI